MFRNRAVAVIAAITSPATHEGLAAGFLIDTIRHSPPAAIYPLVPIYLAWCSLAGPKTLG